MKTITLEKITDLGKQLINNAYKEASLTMMKETEPIHIIMASFRNKNNSLMDAFKNTPKITYNDFLSLNKSGVVKKYYKGEHKKVFNILAQLTRDIRISKRKTLTAKDILVEALKFKETHEILGAILAQKMIDKLSTIDVSETILPRANPKVFEKEFKRGKITTILKKDGSKYKIFSASMPDIFGIGKTAKEAKEDFIKKLKKRQERG